MKVRYMTDWNTPTEWFPKGSERELADAEAKAVVSSGLAEVVKAKPADKPEGKKAAKK
jgi:hypothetical protein